MMLSPIEMMRLTVDGMMERAASAASSTSSRAASRFRSTNSACRTARAPGWSASSAGWRGRPCARNVTINNLLPGIFDSDAQRRHIEGMLERDRQDLRRDLARARAAANPAKRYGRPAELGAYCAFLCSEHAGFITGQNLLVDGGSYPGTF